MISTKNVQRGKGKKQARSGNYRRPRQAETRVVNARKSTGFPDSELTNLRYSDEISVVGGTYGQYTYSGNSAYDPDDTGIGHQPMYFDQYSPIYSRYKVIASTCRITVTNYDAAASAVVVLVPNSEIVTSTSYSIAMEQPYAQRTEQIPISTRQGSQSSVKITASTRRIIGLSAAQLANEDYSASTGSSPPRQWFWNICCFDVSSLSVRILVDIDYRVLFYDRHSPSPSFRLKVVKTEEQIARIKQRQQMQQIAVNYVSAMPPPPLCSPSPSPSPSAGLPGR